MNRNDVRTRIEYAPDQPSPVDPFAPPARLVVERLFPSAEHIHGQRMGTTRGATRFLQVFDVDDVIFGWVEDLPPQGGAVFVEWVWDVEYVEGLGWVADDATV